MLDDLDAVATSSSFISLQSDDLVFQAVLNGQVEIGVGSAYAAIQTLGADSPVRNFYQLKKLGFLCVVNKNKIKSWQDLDGQPITIHARGSGTEAISYYMQAKTKCTALV